MRKIIFLLLIIVSTLKIQAQESDITTYYFIRHAEKIRTDSTNKNPNLTEKGKERSKNWSSVFKNVNFDFIYSTNYNRTIQTATPTAENKNLEIQFYNPKELFNEDFKFKTKNNTVLVVGHSNTTPQFVNAILGNEKYPEIEDADNSNLYIVTIINNIVSAILLKIEY
ncbi:MAG: histidine phosphatase family protein [Lutibacter sp.]|nr:histidine phosphatase family protein [Lutibacter sp.]